MTDSPLLVDVTDGVATLTMNRPEAMNSLDTSLKLALVEAVNAVAADDEVRCVVLTGSGRAFCVGQDLKEHVQTMKGPERDQLFRTVEEHYNPLVTALLTMPKPVVAAVNGVAAGAGASLALACDLRVVGASAGFNLAFSGIALSCDTGSSWTLPRLVGRAKALELLYFPSTIPADDALALGLASQVVPDEELRATTAELAGRLAQGPTLAFAAIRRSVTFSAGHGLEESLALESRMMQLTGASADHAAAVDAFLAKQRPVFEGR
jgi:2-(1,2-epoxy-1,2-dihydrophenyl)acetyl-CoA isomerase